MWPVAARSLAPRCDGEQNPVCAVCAKGGGRHQEPNPLFQVLPEAADGEGHDRKNRSGQSEIAQTGVQAGMSYYINNTMSIGSDPFALLLPLLIEAADEKSVR